METTPTPVPPSPPELSAEPPPLPPPPAFRLHLSAWIVSGVAALVIIGSGFMRSDGLSVHEWGRRSGMAISWLLFPTLVSWIAFRVSRRSQAAATTTFFVVFGLATVGQVLPKLSNVATRATGGLAAVQEGAKRYTDQLKAQQARYDEITAKADALHLLSFDWLTDKALAAPRREAIRAVIAMNQEIRQATLDGERHFRQALESSGTPAASLEEALRGFRQSRADKLQHMLKARDTEEQIFQAAIKLIDLLEAEWGHWSREDGKIAFEDDDAIAKFNALMADIQTAAKEQEAAQRHLTLISN